ncbi:MAG: cupin domain-containing protein [Deltaproteobacteria bacterium]|nr:cupin domain-containing protein [Deltaproteobacteria bacterium]
MRNLIAHYGLRPHPEGGFYREVYRSQQTVTSSLAGAERRALTHIYFLLLRDQISRFHRVRHDEVWNFYEGAPLTLVTFDGTEVRTHRLGPGADYVLVVAGGLFQAAASEGAFSLVGCTVAPGFEFADFSFLAEDPDLSRCLEQNAPDYCRFL